MAFTYKNLGNTARVLETRRDAKEKPVVKLKKRRSVVFVYENDHRHRLSVLTVITLSLIFTGAAGTAVTTANITVAKQKAISLSNQLRDVRSQNADLAEEVNRCYDVAAVREAARKDLDMAMPDAYQTRRIQVPEENHPEYGQP